MVENAWWIGAVRTRRSEAEIGGWDREWELNEFVRIVVIEKKIPDSSSHCLFCFESSKLLHYLDCFSWMNEWMWICDHLQRVGNWNERKKS
jgi:hypothetical protein